MLRYIAPGPLAVNKRIAERLFLKTYDLELEQANEYRIWAYRKAAWAVDESEQSVAEIYTSQGEAGLQGIARGREEPGGTDRLLVARGRQSRRPGSGIDLWECATQIKPVGGFGPKGLWPVATWARVLVERGSRTSLPRSLAGTLFLSVLGGQRDHPATAGGRTPAPDSGGIVTIEHIDA
jgi:hypothetical protein